MGKRGDELGQLSQDFDRMASQLEQLLTTQKRMLRDISHELRSPLARLQVALELARKSAQGLAGNEHDRIETEIIRLNELIGQVISLVKLETGQQTAELTPLNLNELVTEAVNNADFEARPQGKSAVLTSNGPLTINGNHELLYSALENILRNAVKYTPTKTRVETCVSQHANQAIITIRDHGPGVSATALEHLFEPFYREADARDRSSGGYGLGLAIAKRAITHQGGTISARNADDGGLEVALRLPLKS